MSRTLNNINPFTKEALVICVKRKLNSTDVAAIAANHTLRLDSQCEFMSLIWRHDEAFSLPLPHDELEVLPSH